MYSAPTNETASYRQVKPTARRHSSSSHSFSLLMADLINLFKPMTESRASAPSSPTGISAAGSPFHAYKKAKADFYGNRFGLPASTLRISQHLTGGGDLLFRFTSALHVLNQILECELARRRDIIDALLLRGEVKCAQNDHTAGYAGMTATLSRMISAQETLNNP